MPHVFRVISSSRRISYVAALNRVPGSSTVIACVAAPHTIARAQAAAARANRRIERIASTRGELLWADRSTPDDVRIRPHNNPARRREPAAERVITHAEYAAARWLDPDAYYTVVG